jgi:hypothetical protein
MSLESNKSRIDGWMNAFVVHLNNYQDAQGFPWQGLSSHSNRPAHTNAGDNDVEPDLLDESPTDQPVSWNTADFIPQPINTWPCDVTVDVYEGPSGTGYVVRAGFDYEGDHWIKSWNYGPETYRTVDWTLVEEL